MSKSKRFNKSKLLWRFYTGENDDRIVEPHEFRRLHAPLDNILQSVAGKQGCCVHLRCCAEGVDKNGKVVAYLFCTENNNRFFDQDKDGFWNEHKPAYTPNGPASKSGGCNNYTFMSNFGALRCHKLVAHAWVENRYHYIVDVWCERKGKRVFVCIRQVDHRDGNPLNNNAENLEYVTPAENTRRATLFRRLRKTGFDPASCTTAALRIILSATSTF